MSFRFQSLLQFRPRLPAVRQVRHCDGGSYLSISSHRLRLTFIITERKLCFGEIGISASPFLSQHPQPSEAWRLATNSVETSLVSWQSRIGLSRCSYTPA